MSLCMSILLHSLNAQLKETVVNNEGKVLIPVYAVGRLQELLLVVEEFWERHDLKVPIYVAGEMSGKANEVYARFVEWCSADTVENFELTGKSPFASSLVQKFEKSYINAPGPMVVFATPGSMEGGVSRQLLKSWSSAPENLIVLPGHYVPGTVGAKLLERHSAVDLAPSEIIEVKCRLLSIPYSAHTDRDGIIEMVSKLRPTNVVLVHGEVTGMTVLQHQLQHKLYVPTFSPANHTELMLPLGRRILVEVDTDAIVPLDGSATSDDRSHSENAEDQSDSDNIDLNTLRNQIESQLDEDRRLARKRTVEDNENTSYNASDTDDAESSKFTGCVAEGSQLRFVGPGNIRLVAPSKAV
eukprot:gb/GECG01000264.1/.p1 GENE.gb/GECG01000264.1/~~gb/GECG01000264.1/.p1  ORF type:complete len:356 (+),score=43.85 gb/GECG01000264.1/:1-1068(+)